MFGWWRELPPGLFFRRDQPGFERMKTQATTLSEQIINDGFAFNMNWLESSIPPLGYRYVELTVPAGFYLAITFRELNPEKEAFFYRVFPEGVYTVTGTLANDANNHVRASNLNVKSTLAPAVTSRVTVSANPTPLQSVPGTTVISWGIPSSASGNRSSGELNGLDIFRLVGNGTTQTKFLLQLENAGASAAHCQVVLTYALVPVSIISNPASG